VTSAYSVVSVMGPKAEALLGGLGSNDLSKARMPFGTTTMIDVGHARARAARMSYVGGPGYELYVPTDQCATLYDALSTCGDEFGLKDAGYYTIDALRIEAGRRAWGAELSPDETPWEAGLGYAVRWTSPSRFVGLKRCKHSSRKDSTKRLVPVYVRRPRGVSMGRRADPHERPQCRRADVDRLFAPPGPRRRNGLCAQRRRADG
jgi:4-methylaminobutanoate oxidase (formaldehyde-forming)